MGFPVEAQSLEGRVVFWFSDPLWRMGRRPQPVSRCIEGSEWVTACIDHVLCLHLCRHLEMRGTRQTWGHNNSQSGHWKLHLFLKYYHFRFPWGAQWLTQRIPNEPGRCLQDCKPPDVTGDEFYGAFPKFRRVLGPSLGTKGLLT